MTREEAYDLLGPYVDDELPEEARRRLETMLFQDKDLAWEAQTLAITRARMREGIGEVTASDAFRARVLNALHRDNAHLGSSETESVDETQFRLPIVLG